MGTGKICRCIKNIQKSLNENERENFLLQSEILLKEGDFEVPKYCIDKFIKNEMDQQSPSIRGIGRLTDEIPRFGGYYRNAVLHLYEEEAKELQDLFKVLMYTGYFTHIALYEKTIRPSECNDQYKLYQMWIMYILGLNQEDFSQGIKFIEEASKMIRDQIKSELRNLDFKLNNQDEKVLDKIMLFYGLSGFILRRGEVGFSF